MKKHYKCIKGASVRLNGYAPAKVLRVYMDFGAPYADCIVTGRSSGWKLKQIGPHGYRTGDLVTVRVVDAVPHDTIRISKQQLKQLIWEPIRYVLNTPLTNTDTDTLKDPPCTQ